MKFLDKLKDIFNKIFKRNDIDLSEFLPEEKTIKQLPVPELQKEGIYESILLPEGEIVSFDDEILDTNSKISQEKFIHNLEILMNKAKENGKIDKFILIREDDFFPTGWEWKVLSKNTNLEKVCTSLSYELKKAYALEQLGIEPYREIMGITALNASYEKTNQALKQVDKTLGSVLLPSRFRSTRHFTINTPLEVTGSHNSVKFNRNYIILDDISTFLKSDYAYSVSYHDAYLDVSHESLPISQGAIVLINDENYERIMSDEKTANELSQKKVVRFTGDSDIAIDMILTQMGALPSTVGLQYAHYDNEIHDIIDNSIKNLAKENSLFFDKIHGGKLELGEGHFSNYYDDKNKDYLHSIKEFTSFLRERFPEQEELFPEYLTFTGKYSEEICTEIVYKIGTVNLLKAINEYNELANARLEKTLEEYSQDRKNITPEIHRQFVDTINLINEFYKNEVTFASYKEQSQIEEVIQKFLQGDTVQEQLESAKSVWKLLPNKNISKTEPSINNETISMRYFVENAINQGIGTEHVEKYDNVILTENQKPQVEGGLRDDSTI